MIKENNLERRGRFLVQEIEDKEEQFLLNPLKSRHYSILDRNMIHNYLSKGSYYIENENHSVDTQLSNDLFIAYVMNVESKKWEHAKFIWSSIKHHFKTNREE